MLGCKSRAELGRSNEDHSDLASPPPEGDEVVKKKDPQSHHTDKKFTRGGVLFSEGHPRSLTMKGPGP